MNKLKGADGIRALACLMVMAHHAFQRLNLPVQSPEFQNWQLFLLQGSTGVSVFFVLSGFLLAGPFWSAWFAGNSLPSLKVYAARRAARIVPGFYLSLLVTFAIVITFLPHMVSPWWRLFSGLSFTSELYYVTMFPVELNGPLWSIGFEVFSYLLLPLFMVFLFRVPALAQGRSAAKGLGWWLGVFVLVLLLNAVVNEVFVNNADRNGWEYGMVGGAKYWMPRMNPLGFFGHFSLGIFAAGACAALARRPGQPAAFRSSLVADAAAILGLAGAFVTLWMLKEAPEFSFSVGDQPYWFPLFPGCFALALACLPHSRFAGALLDNPVFRFLARISFGLYVWHYLLLELARMFWRPDLQYFGISDMGDWAGVVTVVYAGTVLIATASWYLLEKPILERVRRREARVSPQ